MDKQAPIITSDIREIINEKLKLSMQCMEQSFERFKYIDSKLNMLLVALSSIVAALGFVLQIECKHRILINHLVFFLILSLLGLLISIIGGLWIRGYRTIDESYYIDFNNNDEIQFKSKLIKSYEKCIKTIDNVNSKKEKFLKVSTVLLVTSFVLFCVIGFISIFTL